MPEISKPGLITRREAIAGTAVAALAARSATAQPPRPSEIAQGVIFDADAPDRRGIPGVLVSNGEQVVRTDREGRWKLPIEPGASVFVIKPSDWTTPLDSNNLPRYAYLYQPRGTPADLGLRYRGIAPTGPLPETIDFPLHHQVEPRRFEGLLFTDPQPESPVELAFVRDDVVAQAASMPGAFGITLGDIMFDDLSMYHRSNQIHGAIGRPWYNCCGNHDMNYEAPSDTFSRETFKRYFGARYTAFQHGGATFFLLDNVEYLGNHKYQGRFGPRQLAFIRNVLALLPPEELTVFCFHIPLRTAVGEDANVAAIDRRAFLETISGRPNSVSFSGHTHTNEHYYFTSEDGFAGGDMHHHHVLSAVSGSWWSGPFDERGIPVALGSDGAPNGFHMLSIDHQTCTTRMIPAHDPARSHMRIMLEDSFHGGSPEVIREYRMGQLLGGPLSLDAVPSTNLLVNLYDGGPRSEVSYSIDDSATRPMQRILRTDPFVVELYARNADTKKPWVQPTPCTHLWQASLPENMTAGAHRLLVLARDESGANHRGGMILEIQNG